MAPFLKKGTRYIPHLLALTAVLTLMSDTYFFRGGAPSTPSTRHAEDGHTHAEGSGTDASGKMPADPVKQRRMGIYHYNEGNKLLRQGNWKEAVHHYEMALNHDTNLIEVYLNLSSAYMKGKEYERARATLETLKSKAPKLPALHYNLACYYALTGKSGPALDELKTAVRLGFKNFAEILSDPDLQSLRDTPAYKEWMKHLPIET